MYDSDTAPTVASGTIAVGISILFSAGLLLLVNSHNSNQNRQLQQTIAAISKSQAEGIDISTALAQLTAANPTKDKSKAADPGPINGNFDTLAVKEATTLLGNVRASRDLSVVGNLGVRGDTTLEGTLTATETTITGLLTAKDNVAIEGSLDGSSVAALGGTLSVAGATTLADSLDVGGAALFSSSFDVAGAASIAGNLEIGGSATISESLDVNVLTIDDTLEVGGAASLGNTLAVTGATTLTATLDVAGATTIDGGAAPVALAVTGATTLADTLAVTGAVTIDGGAAPVALAVTGATTIGTTLGITGGSNTITLESLSTSGNITVTAGASGTNNLTGEFTAGAINNNQSLCTTTCSFSNTGGVSSTATVNGNLTQTTNGGISVGALQNTLAACTSACTVTNPSTLAASVSATDGISITGAVDIGSSTIEQTACTQNCTATSGATSVTLTGALTVTSSVLGGASFSASSITTTNGAITITNSPMGDSTTINATTVNGGLTTGTAEIGTLTVSGSTTTINGNVQVGDGDLGEITAAGQITSSANIVSFGSLVVGATDAAGANAKTILHASGAIQIGANIGRNIVDADSLGGEGPNNNTLVTCGSGDSNHIRISRIENGIVTGAVCGSDGVGATNYDIAENFPSSQSLSEGDVVAIDATNNEHVVRSNRANDNFIIGVVSTAPGITLGKDGPGYPVALAGRVPVKVTNEGGAIAAGDYLTSSSTPGHAKKAVAGEKTIGQAMSGFSGSVGTVIMFVNTSGGNVPQQEFVQGTQSPTQNGVGSFSSLNVSGPSTLTNLQVTGVATVAELHVTGQANVVNLSISGHIVGNDDTRGTATVKAGEKVVHKDFTTPYGKAPVVVASPTNEALPFVVVPTPTGFDIKLNSPATTDTSFNYLVQE